MQVRTYAPGTAAACLGASQAAARRLARVPGAPRPSPGRPSQGSGRRSNVSQAAASAPRRPRLGEPLARVPRRAQAAARRSTRRRSPRPLAARPGGRRSPYVERPRPGVPGAAVVRSGVSAPDWARPPLSDHAAAAYTHAPCAVAHPTTIRRAGLVRPPVPVLLALLAAARMQTT